jgi:hypothetical protein
MSRMRLARARMVPVHSAPRTASLIALRTAVLIAPLLASLASTARASAGPPPALASEPSTVVTPAPTSARVAEISPPMPRLTLSAGFIFGPHAKGEADCQDVEGGYECQHNGNFLGAGATIELRAQLYKLLYLHVRGLLVSNLRKRPRAVHSGLAGGGIGLGAYSRLAFVRAEYLLVPTLGSDRYVPPFYDKPEARDVYGLHAAMLSAGVHKYVSPRVAIEGWAGLVVGPSSRRTTVNMQADEGRVLVSFMINLGLSFDVLLAKGYKPPPRPPRKRREW